MAGIPETIGVLGEKMLAMKFASGIFLPLYLAVITVEAKYEEHVLFVSNQIYY
jgi:hypothetical protein